MSPQREAREKARRLVKQLNTCRQAREMTILDTSFLAGLTTSSSWDTYQSTETIPCLDTFIKFADAIGLDVVLVWKEHEEI